MEDRGGINFILGMFVGAFVGAATAILLAPQSGEITRGQLRDGAERVRERLEKYGKDFREDAGEFVERGHRYMDDKYREIRTALSKKMKNSKQSADQEDVEVADSND